MERGFFITLEGGEGAGKSTQTRRLAAQLRLEGYEALETREPGGSPGGEQIRQLLVRGETARWDALSEALLLFAARHDHRRRLLAPALARGTWVVCDRFTDSTLAYQGYGHGLPLETLRRLDRLVMDGFHPDLTLLLDLPVEIGLARAKAREGTEDRFESLDLAFHKRLREGFLALAAAEPRRFAVIDADASEEEVAARILTAVREHRRAATSAHAGREE
jgi:dTMP kinase